jgi:hypothetical protein
MADAKKKDRHRPGYYKEYAKRTGRKDRHRPGYYREYNLKHPERIARLFGDEDVHPNSCEGLGQWCD